MQSDKPVSVVMLVPSVPPSMAGGAELQALRLAESLKAAGVRVLVLSEWQPGLPERDIISGVEIVRRRSFLNTLWRLIPKPASKKPSAQTTDFSGASGAVKTASSLRRFGWRDLPYVLMTAANMFMELHSRRREFQIIHAHHAEWDGFIAVAFARLLGKKAVVKDSTINGFSRLRHDLFGGLMMSVMMSGGYFVAMTEAIRKNLLSSGVPEKRISLIPNGVSLPALESKSSAGRYCLFVGNLTQQPAKGFDVLLRAWGRISAANPGVNLIVAGAGDGPYRKYASSLGVSETVIFKGPAADMKELYGGADVFVMPSRREGMSNALLEAMSFALPCVASDVSGVRDLIADGEGGLVVPPDDEEALVSAVSRLLADRDFAVRLGRTARRVVESRCSFPLVAQQYINLYRSLVYGDIA